MVQTSSIILAATAILLAASPAIAADNKDAKSVTTTATSATSTATPSGTSKDSKDGQKGVQDHHRHHHHHPHHHHRLHRHHHHHHHHSQLNGLDHLAHEHHDEHTQHNLLAHNEHLKDTKTHGHEHEVHPLGHPLEKSNKPAQKVDLKTPANQKVDAKAHPTPSTSTALPSQTSHVEKAKPKPKTKLQLAIDELYKLNGREYFDVDVRDEQEAPSYGEYRQKAHHGRVHHYSHNYARHPPPSDAGRHVIHGFAHPVDTISTGAHRYSHNYARHPPPSAYLDESVHTYNIPNIRRPIHGASRVHSPGAFHYGHSDHEVIRPNIRTHNIRAVMDHPYSGKLSYKHEEYAQKHHEPAHSRLEHDSHGYRHQNARSWDDDLDEIMARSYYDFYDDLD